jgi:hypothetical protein
MGTNLRPHALSLAFALTLTGLTARARAQTDDGDAAKLAAAEGIYDEAARAMTGKDFATACPMLEEVVRLVPHGVGGRLTLAECYEGEDKLGSAYSSYLLAERMAREANQPERRRKAHDRIVALKPKLATLAIDVSEELRSLAGLEVQRDGVPVALAEWGAATPVDRGLHVIRVTAAGKEPLQRSVEVSADGVGARVAIDAMTAATVVPAPLEKPSQASPGPAEPACSGAATPPETAPDRDAPPPETGRRVAGFIVGGIGVAGLAIGTGTGILALLDHGAVASQCPQQRWCSPDVVRRASAGKSMSIASTAAFTAGAVGVGVGVILVLSNHKGSGPEVGFALRPDGGRLGILGAF